MPITPFPIKLEGADLNFGKSSISLIEWDYFLVTKNKTYRVELYCHRKVAGLNFRTVLRLHCKEESVWHRCIKTLLETQLQSSVFYARNVTKADASTLQYQFSNKEDLELLTKFVTPLFRNVKVTIDDNLVKLTFPNKCDLDGIQKAIHDQYHNSCPKLPIDSHEYERQFNVDKEGITEIIRGIQVPASVEEIDRWIANPVSMFKKQDAKCRAYLKEQIMLAHREKDHDKVDKLMVSAATIPHFNYRELLKD